jgi:NTE family protein
MFSITRRCAGFLFLLALLPATLGWAQSETSPKPKRLKLGVALSGGGARGLAHIGVLKVMEEAGLRPDYITGTSMGSVVGALYASGYTAAQIETMVKAEDLSAILMDQVARGDRTVLDKQEDGKHQLAIPIKQGKITLPKGLIAGQNVTLLFSRLLFPVRDVSDFHKLPIPFECMATDIVTGEDVIMDHGNLVQAVRTSMAIPSVFTPVEREGRLLVDGGVTRNLPVSNLFDMGADVVIAVDVAAFKLPREKLDSLMAIFDQGSAITSRPAAVAQAKLSDLVIEPNVVEYSIAAFGEAEGIIATGEKAARAKFSDLQAMARRIGASDQPPRPVKEVRPPEADFVHVADIQIKGLKEVPKSFVDQQLHLSPNTWVSNAQIQDAMKRAYATGRFVNVTYEFEPAKDGETLVINTIESVHSSLNFGLAYNSELKAMLLLNGTFHNILMDGAELKLDAYLSPYLVFRGSYLYHPNWQGDVALGLRAEYQNGELSVYNDDQVAAFSQQKNWQLDLVTQSSVGNAMIYGIGVQKEIIFLSGITPESLDTAGLGTTESFNGLMYARLDTLDDSFYPTGGTLVDFEGTWKTDLLSFYDTAAFVPFGQALLEASEYIPFAERFSVSLGARGGSSFGKPVNQAEYFFLGGMTSLGRHRVPFMGTRLVQQASPNVAVAQLGLQWEVMKSAYFQIKGNLGWTGQELNEVFHRSAMLIGYGATLGMLSPIGPLEVTVMSSDVQNGLAGYFNLGYRF